MTRTPTTPETTQKMSILLLNIDKREPKKLEREPKKTEREPRREPTNNV